MGDPMRKLILSTLSTLALLIYPLYLSAQNSFSLSLDVNGAAGDQAVTSLNVSADQIVTIQIFGKDIQNANGLAVRFEYDAGQVVYEGFDAGDVLPNAQALPEQGTNPTFVEIGIASLGGQATANSGLVGTVRFRATAAFSGTEIRLVRAELSRGGRFETIMPNIRIALQGAPTPANFSLSLDVDGSTGDQAVTSVAVSADEVVAIQIFGTDILNANGISIRFEYDASQVVYEGFEAGDVLPNAQALPEQGSAFVEIGIVSFGGQATANSGLVGTVRFRATAAFSGTAIRLVRAELGRGGQIESATIDVRVELKLQVLTPDFNRDGVVNFADFLAFGGQYGARQGNGRYDAKYDLDSDGAIGFGDFLIFSSSFGKEVSTPGGGGGGSTGIVDIPDANLRAVIADSLGKARNASITRAEMATLTRLEASNANISDLTGLEFANGLTSLDLEGNLISDVSALAGLTNLTTLWLPGNLISDISPLANLTKIWQISFSSNLISDISPLANLTKLEWVYLNDNLISDISALAGLTELKGLGLSNNEISVVSPLSGLTNLTWDLSLSNNIISDISALSGMNPTRLYLNDNIISDISALSGMNPTRLYLNDNIISDISALSGMTNLEILYLWGNSISDVSALSNLTNLIDLALANNTISDVSALSNLTNLTRMTLVSNTISDISALAGLTNLTTLWLVSNTISDISALAGLTNLTWLSLSNNVIADVSALSRMTHLQSLDLSNNIIADVSALSRMTHLTYLDIDQNTISSISPLAGLNKLEYLALNSNLISDISPLANLTNLTELWLNSNAFSNISPLSGLTNLERLYLYNNAISDISPLTGLTHLELLVIEKNLISDLSPLVANTGLGSGDRVYVKDNPLSATSLNTHIPALQARGVTVNVGSSKPAVAEKETRMPRAVMEQFGVGEREEAEYRYHKQMEMKEDMISRKLSLQDKARREIKSTTKIGNHAGTSED